MFVGKGIRWESEHAGLVLMQDALVGLQALAEGDVLNEDELDQVLSAVSARPNNKT